MHKFIKRWLELRLWYKTERLRVIAEAPMTKYEAEVIALRERCNIRELDIERIFRERALEQEKEELGEHSCKKCNATTNQYPNKRIYKTP